MKPPLSGFTCTASAVLALTLLLVAAPHAWAAERIIHMRGLVDLAVSGSGQAMALNKFNRGDSNFDTYRLRLFAETEAAEGFQVFTQFLYEEYADVRAIGAYAMYTPQKSRDFNVVGGKIPWLVGTWQNRTYSYENPLIGAPLMYQYHTSLRNDHLPATVDALLGAEGRGQFGPVYDASGRGYRGMPIVYDLCWDFGVMLTGSERPVEYAFGYVNGAPSSPQAGNDNNTGKSWLGRLGVAPWPGLRVGVSGSYGPYLSEDFNAPGVNVNGFAQKLLMADAEWMVSHLELRAEGFHNEWETPTVGNLDLRGGYVEARVTLPHGAFTATRYDVMRFGNVTDSTGTTRAWDAGVDRLEVGLGYRVNRNVTLKGVFQHNVIGKRTGDEIANLFSAQASVRF